MSLQTNISALRKKFEKEYVALNRVEVSRSAIIHNVGLFERLTSKNVIPVLKGNAYGHGIQLVAKILKKKTVPYIAVDGYFEALKIREVSNQPVLIMGAVLPENFARLKYDNFTFVVDNEVVIQALGQTGKKIKVHLECNSGMNRYGAKPKEIAGLTKLILSYKNLELEGVMSHLADSDGDEPDTVNQAVAIFDACVETVKAAGANPTMFHVAQTAGSLKAKSKYANAVRVGIGTYGINPFAPTHALYEKLHAGLQPALKFTSTITKVIELEKGDKVSYNYTFTAPYKMKIGVLPLGYYEGIDRALSNKGIVKTNESFAPIVGRVCMNHTMINLENADAQAGSEVVIYSNNPSDANAVDNIAKTYELFNYDLLASLSPDVRRVAVD
ncbi:MAG TPA: alanine racemase [Candidatus Saccharimonadales bacterium]|nr:alanine racemase [Candidatus Saccharimonadales bacterium]